MNEIYENDFGTQLILNCKIPVAGATSLGILATRPDGTQVLWTATASGPQAVTYTTQSGDINQVGTWELQAVVGMSNGEWHGEAVAVLVKALGT